MIRGHDKFCAEHDRIVKRYQEIKAHAEHAQDVVAAHEAAVADLHKLGYTIGEAHQILSRRIRYVREYAP